MYENGVNSEDVVNYNSLFCHACLSSNRTLTAVGDYVDIYLKICENSSLNITSQINLCWECMAVLKKVRAFKKKVDNAQKILDYCVNKQAPLRDGLSDLITSCTEFTTFVPISFNDEYEDEDPDKSKELEDSKEDLDLELYDSKEDKHLKDFDDSCGHKNELMIKIEDVRGQCDIVDVEPVLDVSGSSGCDVTVKVEPLSPEASEEEQRYQRWKRSVLLVHKRICAHKYARYFLHPVSDELAPCYSRVVRRPSDLTTIKRRVRDGGIRTTKEFRHALLLMFSNALMYNGSEYNIYHMTMELREDAIRELEILAAAEEHALSPFPPAPPRRRAPAHSPSPPASPPLSAPASPPARPRTSLPAAPPTPPARPVSPPSLPAHNRKKRWDKTGWPEHEHLVALKKYKTTVLL